MGEDTDWDTDTVLEGTTVDTVLATTASVRPRPSPRLLLIPTFMATATAAVFTEATTTARGRLRLPLRLRLTLTFCMVDMVLATVDMVLATVDMVMLATVLATGDTTGDKLPTPLQDLNHRRKTLTLFV